MRMTAYYNENDPKAAAWLRELIKQGCIAPGEVDERSIEDVSPYELRGYAQCHFFAGIGVWSYALRRAGWPDDRPVWTGSCPCQPFSAAGKGAGVSDERHLWPAWYHLITQLSPVHVFGEQVASRDGLGWLDIVQTDLEGAGYASGAIDICAASVGAPHIRQRLWFVAERLGDAYSEGLEGHLRVSHLRHQPRREYPGEARHNTETGMPSGLADGPAGRAGPSNGIWRDADWLHCRDDKWRPVEPGTFPLVDGAPARMVRLRGYGNAINAEVAAAFIRSYLGVDAAGI